VGVADWVSCPGRSRAAVAVSSDKKLMITCTFRYESAVFAHDHEIGPSMRRNCGDAGAEEATGVRMTGKITGSPRKAIRNAHIVILDRP
jgi:hypothetical protein